MTHDVFIHGFGVIGLAGMGVVTLLMGVAALRTWWGEWDLDALAMTCLALTVSGLLWWVLAYVIVTWPKG